VLGGTVGARVFQRFHIPQVVGYVVIGIVVGKSGFGVIGDSQIEALLPATFFALGVIGFLIGSELRLDVFRRYGRQFFAILLSEALGAFLLVSLLTAAVVYLLVGNFAASVALGILLGAIASATAPAATVDVLWEYKTLGPLTTTVLAIVALDDGLALFLFSITSAVAVNLFGGAGSGAGTGLLHTAYELGGAVVLGVGAAALLNTILRHTAEPEKSLAFIVGVLACLLGMSLLAGVDVILAAMALGATLVNLAPRRSRRARETIERFAQPIFVLFFVVVGARLSVRSMAYWTAAAAVAYLVGRTGGKMLGAWVGARASGAAESVRKYLGFCLFSQAGVAIGLSILAGDRFAHCMIGGVSVGAVIVTIVTATTFVVQIIGPPFVKMAAARAGEIGRNVTEAELLNSCRAEEVLDLSVPAFTQDVRVTEIVRAFSDNSVGSFMVTDNAGRIVGMITMDDLRQCMDAHGMTGWLVASDIMRPPPDSIRGDLSLAKSVELMKQQDVESLPVTDAQGRYIGVIERRTIHRKIAREILQHRGGER